MEDYVRIFDTTLRDGEQAPGCTMTEEEKLEIATQLAALGVDIIEAGFPAASPGDWQSVNRIAKEVGVPGGPTICGLARTNVKDIDLCASAIQPAAKKRIHTFLATSDIHMEHKLRMTRPQVLKTAREMVAHARSLCEDVEFSPEDAGRSDPLFLYEVLAVAIESGATTLNIPDTVGYVTPDEYGAMIAGILKNVPGVDRVIISTHCHDDLGLAVANSLAGVRAGARQVECTINGLGERAGNASLEEVVMALHTRRQFFGVESRVNTREIIRASHLVSARTGVRVPPNKAIVGANAFAHEAGIHQDGVLKNPLTYEIMRAETVGLDGNALVLGKHSGRHALRRHLEAQGHVLEEDAFGEVFSRFKELADRKKVLDEWDLESLVGAPMDRPTRYYAIDLVQVSSGSHAIPVATVRLRDGDDVCHTESASGNGAIDAVFKAIAQVFGETVELVEFAVDAVTEGSDAVGQVTVRVRDHTDKRANGATGPWNDRQGLFSARAADRDIIVAAAEAYVAACNKLWQARAARCIA